MKFFIGWILFLLFLFTSAGIADERGHKKLPPEERRTILDTIRPYAITFGEGKKEVHVFVDPMCPLSREYLKWVTSSSKLLKRYRYYVYMYKLKKYDSLNLMRYIYSQEYCLNMLKEVMVKGYEPEIDITAFVKGVDKKIRDIAEAARAIDVYKRPYFIVLRSEKK